MGCDAVTVCELEVRIRMIGAGLVDQVIVQAAGLAGERVDPRETVAPVDVGQVRARTDAVAWIQVAVALDRMPGAPARLRPALVAEFDAAVVWLVRVPGVEFHSAQIVLRSEEHTSELPSLKRIS